MSSRPHGLLRAALRRLSPAPPSDSDADLLDRYVTYRDNTAFTALVRRHGPMVLGVCRRRLGLGPDAEDAFQVTFMVLARDAARIGNGAALPGWLYRVAFLIALKQSGKLGRRPETLPEEPPAATQAPDSDVAVREHLAILDEELNSLPDKLRSVLVLCGLEERTNTEAARLLGCPTGTVDSRLSAARQKLRDRLTRRGLAALAASLPVASEAVGADDVARGALNYVATHGVATDPLSTFADGVSPIMSTTKLKLLAAAGMCFALFGTAGLGLIHATGPDAQKSKQPPVADAKADPAKKVESPKQVEPPKKAEEDEDDGDIKPRMVLPDEAAVRAVLGMKALKLPGDRIPLRELLQLLYHQHGLIVRLDVAAFKRLGYANQGLAAVPRGDVFVSAKFAGDPETEEILALYDLQIRFPATRGLTVADVLTETVTQLPGRCGYRIRDKQVLIGPAYQPPTVPGAGVSSNDLSRQVDERRLLEQIVGEPVSLAIERQTLSDAITDLRKLTGANIVIDARCKDKATQAVSGSFSDVRLLTALTVLADMCELKPVAMNNVYYITTPENAAKLQKQVNTDLYGTPPPTVPAGYVTDGIHLYEKPGNLKPAELILGGGLGGRTGAVPAPPTEKK